MVVTPTAQKLPSVCNLLRNHLNMRICELTTEFITTLIYSLVLFYVILGITLSQKSQNKNLFMKPQVTTQTLSATLKSICVPAYRFRFYYQNRCLHMLALKYPHSLWKQTKTSLSQNFIQIQQKLDICINAQLKIVSNGNLVTLISYKKIKIILL